MLSFRTTREKQPMLPVKPHPARHVLMIFLDGVGLGDDDPRFNPFAAADTPTLSTLASGHRWYRTTGRQLPPRAAFVPTDARMGVPGRPQSGSGQAAIVTGINIPMRIGEHYGPRPNALTRAIISEDNIFKQVIAMGHSAALLEAYPQEWHAAVKRGKRLLSSYQQAAYEAGVILMDESHLYKGDALSVDWTGEAWQKELGYADVPLYSPEQAGRKLVELSRRTTFAFFPHWLTDTIGHRGTVEEGVHLLTVFDGVMRGVLEAWDDTEGLVIITSDHGNLEDLSHGKHTENDVPTVIIGAGAHDFAASIYTLADLTPQIIHYLSTS